MKKIIFLLFVFLLSPLLKAQDLQNYLGVPQTHDIFLLWDMDKWDQYHGGRGSQGDDWHDMDFVCNPTSGFEDYSWKLVVGNSSGSYESNKISLQDSKLIFPSWDSPNGYGEMYLILPNHFEPNYYNLYFYPPNSQIPDPNQTISIQSINLYDLYLYDDYQYYESKINSFSASVNWQTGDINLFVSILQLDDFYITIKVNDITYSNIDEKRIEYHSTTGWERIKTIENLYIDNSWLIQNNLVGQLTIKLILDSNMWNDEYYIVSSGIQNVSINNNPTPTIPSISMSGGIGDNPTLTFTGGGPNVDHFVLKKEYDFGSGYGAHYVDPSSNPYTDPNVEITRFDGDLVARYSVKAVGPTGISSAYSSTVSTDGQSLWKNSNDGENNKDDLAIDKYLLNPNYPNPFNPNTKIEFQIPVDGFVSLKVYNTLGEEVAILMNKKLNAGMYSVNFKAKDLPSGIYIYRLETNNFTGSQKMLLMR